MCQHLHFVESPCLECSSERVMETPTWPIHSVSFRRNVSDDECSEEDSKDLGEDEHLFMERAGEQIINAVAEHQGGQQSIEASIDTAVDVKTQEAFLTELHTNMSVRYPELLFSMASGISSSTNAQVIPTMLITLATFILHMAWFHAFKYQYSTRFTQLRFWWECGRRRYLKAVMS